MPVSPLKSMGMLTGERLRALLDYDPATGEFRWRQPTSHRVKVGQLAGVVSGRDGYRLIGVDGRLYAAARLVFLYMTGSLPSALVDHCDRDRTNNRWANLRLANHQQNAFNSVAHKDNEARLKGVHRHKKTGRWRAQITVGGKKISLGLFATRAAAHRAYLAKAQQLHGEYFNGGDNRQAQHI